MAYRYVIVDDEPIARRGTLKKIEKSGQPFVCVGEASNGGEGLELIRDKNPDLVILDMRMPQTDGLALLSALEEEGIHPQVLIASGYSVFEYARQAIKFSVAEYLLKPFSVDEITGSLRNIIRNLNRGNNDMTKYGQDSEIAVLQKYLYNTYTESDRNFTFKYVPIDKESGAWIVAEVRVTPESRGAFRGLAENAPSSFLLVRAFEGAESELLCSIIAYNARSAGIKDSFIEMIGPIVKKHGLNCGVSNVCASVYGLNGCLKEARYARKNIALNMPAQISCFTAAQPREIHGGLCDIDMLLYFIESGNNGRVTACFRDMYMTALKTGLCVNQLEQVWTDTYEEARYHFARNSTVSIPTKHHFAGCLQACPDESVIPDEAAGFFIRVFRPFVNENIPHGTSSYYEIKYYIDSHYTNMLSLYKISEIFYLNPSYVSQLFKTKGLTTFNRYVTNLRVEKAKELLVAGDFSVNGVAKAVGFENEKYFYKVFKKITGRTPVQYRSMNGREKSVGTGETV